VIDILKWGLALVALAGTLISVGMFKQKADTAVIGIVRVERVSHDHEVRISKMETKFNYIQASLEKIEKAVTQ